MVFKGIMWGEEEHTTSSIQADLESTIDTLKWPSVKEVLVAQHNS